MNNTLFGNSAVCTKLNSQTQTHLPTRDQATKPSIIWPSNCSKELAKQAIESMQRPYLQWKSFALKHPQEIEILDTPAKTKEILKAKINAHLLWNRVHHGLWTRTPSYLRDWPAFLAQIPPEKLKHKDHPYIHEKNIQTQLQKFYEELGRKDISIVTALSSSSPTSTLRIVDRTEQGLIVDGWKAISTMAPISQRCFVAQPLSSFLPQKDPSLCIALLCPLDLKGLDLHCRMPHKSSPRWFVDEIDCRLHFTSCVIPWEYVLIDAEPNLFRKQDKILRFSSHSALSTLPRYVALIELHICIAKWLLQIDRTHKKGITQVIGDFVTDLKTFEAHCNNLYVNAHFEHEMNVWVPDEQSSIAAIRSFGKIYSKQLLALKGLKGQIPFANFSSDLEEFLQEYCFSESACRNELFHKLWFGQSDKLASLLGSKYLIEKKIISFEEFKDGFLP